MLTLDMAGGDGLVEYAMQAPPARTGISSVPPAEFSARRRCEEVCVRVHA